MSSRVRIVQGRNRVRIVIPAAWERGHILALLLTVVLVTLATGVAVPPAISGGDVYARIATTIFVLFCLAGCYRLLWARFGREVITADAGVLIVSRQLFGVGPTRRYDIEAIADLHACPGDEESNGDGFPFTRGVGQIEFVFRGRSRRFGFQVPGADAALVVEALAPFVAIRDPHVEQDNPLDPPLALPETIPGEVVIRPKFDAWSLAGAPVSLAIGAFMVVKVIPELTTFHFDPVASMLYEVFFLLMLGLMTRVFVGALWTMMGRERIAIDGGSSLRLTRSIAGISFSTTYRRDAITQERRSAKETSVVSFNYGGLTVPVGIGADTRLAASIIQRLEALLPPAKERHHPDAADVEARKCVRLLAWLFVVVAAVKLAGVFEAYKVVNPWFTREQAKDAQLVAMAFETARANAGIIYYWCLTGVVLAPPIAIGLARRKRWASYFAGAYAVADAAAVFYVPWGGPVRAVSAIIAAIVFLNLYRAKALGAFDATEFESGSRSD